MQKRKTGIALLLIGAMLLVPMVNVLAEDVSIGQIYQNGTEDRTTTYLRVPLNQKIDALSDIEVDLKALDASENPVGNGNIEKGEIGLGTVNGQTVIIIPIRMKENIKNVKVTVKKGEDSASETTPVYFNGGSDLVTASNFRQYIDGQGNKVSFDVGSGKSEDYIIKMFAMPKIITCGQSGDAPIDPDVNNKVKIDFNPNNAGKEVALFIDPAMTTQNFTFFCKENRILLRNVTLKAEKDDDASGKITVTLNPGLGDVDASAFSATVSGGGNQINHGELSINNDGTTITIPITGIESVTSVNLTLETPEIKIDKEGIEVEDKQEPDTPPTPGTSVPTPEEPENRRLEDNPTDVAVEGLLPKEAVRLEVTPKGKLYDVQLVDEKGNPVYTEELIWVEVPIPEGMQGDNLRVKINGNYVTFERHGDKLVFASRFLAPGAEAADRVVLKDPTGEGTAKDVAVVGTTYSLPQGSTIVVEKIGPLKYKVELLSKTGKTIHSKGPVILYLPGTDVSGDKVRVKVDGGYATYEREASGGFAIPVQF